MRDDEIQFRPCKMDGCNLDAEVVDAWRWDDKHDTGPATTFYATECPRMHRLHGVRYDD